ncbi:MAG: sodium-translocating pyrophosphatase [Clostridiales bacterium]|nr:sodium-translocating pyrophosphatase [Clostridiales bacterium]
MELLMIMAPVAALVALAYALFAARSVKKADEGTDRMKSIAASIRRGASAYLRRQYKTVGIFFAVVFVVLIVLAFAFGLVNKFTPFAFLTGGVLSGLSGFIGMHIAVSANVRTANAAQKSLNSGLKIAFRAGSVMGFVVVGLGLIDFSIWYFLTTYAFKLDPKTVTEAMITFGLGASSMALFARVGGGIFTKAADVGADLVGKVEAGIPEDDPRNPAVIADNVGDNVGDVAGMGADLYESYVGSLLSAVALGYAALGNILGIIIPVGIASIGIFASLIGTLFVRTGEKLSSKSLLAALRRGTYIASAISAVGSLAFILLVNIDLYYLFFAMLAGLVAGVAIGFFTEYFTSDNYRPTKNLAKSTQTGSATEIISGLSLGMLSTVVPVIIVAAAVIVSFLICGGTVENPQMGLFGIGIAAVGMLSTLGITLATDAYGPIADNAGGIAQMADMPEYVRERTDALDALGNTTAATGKGFAIGSAALTALALLSSFVNLVESKLNLEVNLSIMNPAVLIGLFIGCMLPFLFSALTMSAIGKSAEGVVLEVRRQFKEIVGIMDGTSEPDYHTCVDICTKASLKQMILPSIITVIAPILVGLLLGISGVAGMLLGATSTGFMLAIMMSNSGGAWDNAKKFIENGNFDGKGSTNHKAAVVGDTVGDPFKDTSGPAINILIKLLSIVSIVFASVIAAFPSIF